MLTIIWTTNNDILGHLVRPFVEKDTETADWSERSDLFRYPFLKAVACKVIKTVIPPVLTGVGAQEFYLFLREEQAQPESVETVAQIMREFLQVVAMHQKNVHWVVHYKQTGRCLQTELYSHLWGC